MKNSGEEDEQAKSRHVAQGHNDKEKEIVFHNVSTLQQRSIRMLTSSAANMGYRVFTQDVSQAYLQSAEKLTRDIYLIPKEKDLEFLGIESHQALKLRKPLYGLCDSGDYWNDTVERFVAEDMDLNALEGDPSMFIQEDDEEDGADGIFGVYVDDTIGAGDDEFEDLTAMMGERFESKEREFENVKFFGLDIKTGTQGVYEMSQRSYIEKLMLLPSDASFQLYRSVRAAASWVTHTRPDICCAVNKAAQVKDNDESQVSTEDIKLLNSAIKRMKKTQDMVLSYAPLDLDSLHLRVYTDASFGCNTDYTSQLGYVILLCDSQDRCHVLDFASKKCKRVVLSILGGDVYAFTEGFNCAFMVRRDLERIYGKRIPIQMRTDSKQMFDVDTKGSKTAERRLMIDVAASRQSYKEFEISDVGLVRSENNVADGLSGSSATYWMLFYAMDWTKALLSNG